MLCLPTPYDAAVRVLDRPATRRALRDGAIVTGLLFAAYLFVVVAPAAGTFGFDAFAYWAVDGDAPYDVAVGALGAFTYSPVVARLFDPFGALEWWQFLWLWTGLLLGTAIWLGGRWALAVLAFPPVALELYHGNVNLLIAAAIVIGWRFPAAWAFVLLTKLTPGVGLLWFAARREWRPLFVVGGVTAALVLVSLIVDGSSWSAWSAYLLDASGGRGVAQARIDLPILLRVPAAALLVIWGGLTDRPWTVPLSAAVAMPVLWPTSFAVLAAIPAQRRFFPDRG
jgi:hypothetical protein